MRKILDSCGLHMPIDIEYMLWMQVDMITPLCSQLTYEGLLDEAS
jgi:hypothetical protein